MKKNLSIFLISSIFLVSCSIFQEHKFGTVAMSVKFPDNMFKVKMIPTTTNLIDVAISGEGLIYPQNYKLTRENSKKLIENIPVGIKLVDVLAKDLNGNSVASGKNTIIIEGGKLNKLELVLIPISNSASSANTSNTSENPTDTSITADQTTTDSTTPIDTNTNTSVDPNTVTPIDPNTGLPITPIDPNTGLPIDPNAVTTIDPNTGLPITPIDSNTVNNNATSGSTSTGGSTGGGTIQPNPPASPTSKPVKVKVTESNGANSTQTGISIIVSP